VLGGAIAYNPVCLWLCLATTDMPGLERSVLAMCPAFGVARSKSDARPCHSP
jgi:hypothetical protein